MRVLNSVVLSLASCFLMSTVLAADAAVSISSPVAGSTFSPSSKIDISYTATPGPKGDHVHLYMDDQKPVVLKQLAGSYTLGALTPGKHGVCIRIVDSSHAEIGVQDCVMFRVE